MLKNVMSCKYNNYVDCVRSKNREERNAQCANCGWNPRVMANRSLAIRSGERPIPCCPTLNYKAPYVILNPTN